MNSLDHAELVLGTGEEEMAELRRHVSLVESKTAFDEDELGGAVYRLAAMGFNVSEIEDLLFPIARFAEDMSEPVERTSEEVAEQLCFFWSKFGPVSVEGNLLDHIRDVVEMYPVSASEIFDGLRRVSAIAGSEGYIPAPLIYQIGIKVDHGFTPEQAGKHLSRRIEDNARER